MRNKRQLQKEIDWLLREKYNGKIAQKAKKDIELLRKGEPADYLIGYVEFLSCKVDLSMRPFIPRPETEFWVEQVINFLKGSKKENLRCLDLFAGSGCIGIALLKHLKKCFVDFGEKEKKFLKQIRINLEINKIPSKRYRLIQTDVFSKVKDKYDFIFANPPYVALERKHLLQKSVADYEPSIALFAGKQGLRYIKILIEQSKNYLKEKGKIFIEVDPFQKKEIEKILKMKKDYNSWEFLNDQFDRPRVLCLEV
jgi:release factor glutamine methyltransferase